jgi:hypothetical protein
MSVLSNYIYYSICEKAYDLFEESNFMTFRNFCNGIKYEIDSEKLDNSSMNIISNIYVYLEVIYAIREEENINYILDFFSSMKYIEYEEPMLLTVLYYKNAIN